MIEFEELAELIDANLDRQKGESRQDRVLRLAELAKDLRPAPFLAADVVGARVDVESVSAYGLDIRLDANGNAVSVGFPYGAEIREPE